uniref:Uncharacterized protein n=1 Tax=Cacopsylla melanoneura TaxID=428564 RepID=A0A8D8UHK4_9HEMI
MLVIKLLPLEVSKEYRLQRTPRAATSSSSRPRSSVSRSSRAPFTTMCASLALTVPRTRARLPRPTRTSSASSSPRRSSTRTARTNWTIDGFRRAPSRPSPPSPPSPGTWREPAC